MDSVGGFDVRGITHSTTNEYAMESFGLRSEREAVLFNWSDRDDSTLDVFICHEIYVRSGGTAYGIANPKDSYYSGNPVESSIVFRLESAKSGGDYPLLASHEAGHAVGNLHDLYDDSDNFFLMYGYIIDKNKTDKIESSKRLTEEEHIDLKSFAPELLKP